MYDNFMYVRVVGGESLPCQDTLISVVDVGVVSFDVFAWATCEVL